MKKRLLSFLLLAACLSPAAAQPPFEKTVEPLPGERWWGGFVALGNRMPYPAELAEQDLARINYNNQSVPLLLSSFNIRKTEDPSGNTGSDVGSHDNTDCLFQFHHTRVNETDNHYGCRGRRLNYTGNCSSKCNSFQRCVCHSIQESFQLISGNHFQAVAHQ